MPLAPDQMSVVGSDGFASVVSPKSEATTASAVAAAAAAAPTSKVAVWAAASASPRPIARRYVLMATQTGFVHATAAVRNPEVSQTQAVRPLEIMAIIVWL